MNFINLAKNRYSCRKFDSRPVEDQKLNLILEAGRIAPSAANYQPWHFIVIRETDNLRRIHAIYHREWFMEAPCVIIICGDHSQSWKRKDGKDHCDIDIAIAVDHMTLQAAELGLGTCWICNFDKDLCIELLNLPMNLEPAVILPVGYPLDSADPDRHDMKRKPFGEIVSFESYK
ncbi:MAG: nitroreductase [Bacteroides sp. SM23_62_1]|nr:MAG: nitroreductase [Bacteroides sp. SM23_62_1]